MGVSGVEGGWEHGLVKPFIIIHQSSTNAQQEKAKFRNYLVSFYILYLAVVGYETRAPEFWSGRNTGIHVLIRG